MKRVIHGLELPGIRFQHCTSLCDIDVVDFPRFMPGKARRKTVTIKNLRYTAVRISTWLADHENDPDAKHVVLETTPRPVTSAYAGSAPASSTCFSLDHVVQHQLVGTGQAVVVKVTFDSDIDLPQSSTLLVRVGQEEIIRVPVRATPESAKLVFPAQISLGKCALGETLKKSFTLKNLSALSTTWKLNVPEPFVASPMFGVLDPGSACEISIDVTHQQAAHLLAEAELKFDAGDGHRGSDFITLDARYLFPLLLFEDAQTLIDVNERSLEFGELDVGKTASLSLTLRNTSPVDVRYHIDHAFLEASVFSISGNNGIIKAGGTNKFLITFSPEAYGQTFHEEFHISIPFTSKLTVSCHGTSPRPLVVADVQEIDFGQLESGKRATASITLTNLGTVPLEFKVNGALDCDISTGTIPALKDLTIPVSLLLPPDTVLYEALLFVFDLAPPIKVFYKGTSISFDTKLLSPVRYRNYQRRKDLGLHLLSPNNFQQKVREGAVTYSQHEDGSIFYDLEVKDMRSSDSKAELALPIRSVSRITTTQTPKEPHGDSTEASEDQTASNDIISFSRTFIDFGLVPFGSRKLVAEIPEQQVLVSNHSELPINFQWYSANSMDFFNIQPRSAVIHPDSHMLFSIKVIPTHGQTRKFQTMTGFAVFQYDSTGDPLDFLPFPMSKDLALQCITNDLGIESYQLADVLVSSELTFPVSHLTQASHATLKLRNPTNAAIPFKLPLHTDFVSVDPASGLIPPQNELWLPISINHPSEGKWKITLPLEVGNELAHIECTGLCSELKVHCPSHLALPPVCTGWSSANVLIVRNTSLIAASASISFLGDHATVFRAFPERALVEPNENQEFRIIGRSELHGTFQAFSVIRYNPEHDTSKELLQEHRVKITFQVEAPAVCLLDSADRKPDLGKIVVGSEAERTETIRNLSDAILTCRLTHTGGASTRVVPGELVIPPKGISTFSYFVSPNHEGRDHFSISCDVVDEADDILLAEVLLEGAYQGTRPKFSVRDVRSTSFSTANLWRRFNIAKLNAALNPLPNVNAEDKIHDLDFGVAPHLDDDTVVVLYFVNESACECTWSLSFVTETAWTPELWADSVPLSNQEEIERMVMKHKLFTVFPKGGTMAPGESCSVTFRYKHDMVDEHSIRMFLNRENSPDVISFMLKGQTLPAGQSVLQLENTDLRLPSVPVGLPYPSEQLIKLRNPCDVPLDFSLDTSDVELLTARNYNFAVIHVPVVKGTIAPRSTLALPITFRPLREKEYAVTLPITTVCQGIESTFDINVTATGCIMTEESVICPTQAAAIATSEGVEDDDDDLFTEHRVFLDVPRTPAIQVSGMIGHLSCDFVDMGTSPLHSVQRRAVFVVNDLTSDTIEFSWDFGRYTHVLSAFPPCGFVLPGERIGCKLVFDACDGIRQYDMDVQCVITNHSAAEKLRKERDRARRHNELIKEEFTLTDKHRLGRGHAGGIRAPKGSTKTTQVVPLDKFSHSISTTGTSQSLLKAGSMSALDRPDSGGPKLQPVTGQRQVVATDMDLRTGRYQPLPPIELKNNDVVIEPMHDLPQQRLLLNICAEVISNERFNEISSSDERATMFVKSAAFCNISESMELVWKDQTQRAVGVSLLEELISEALHDRSLADDLDRRFDIPIPPYYGLKARNLDKAKEAPITPHQNHLTSDNTLVESTLEELLAHILFESDL